MTFQDLLAKLPPKRQRFVQEYLVDQNGTQAAIRAGYAENSAQTQSSRMLSFAMIKACVDAGLADLAEETKETAKGILADLRECADKGLGRIPTKTTVLVDGKSISIEEIRDDIANARASLELIGKHIGMFKEQVDLNLLSYISEEPFDREKETRDWIQKTGAKELLLESTTRTTERLN